MPSASARPMAHAHAVRHRSGLADVRLLIVVPSLEQRCQLPTSKPPIPKKTPWELQVGNWKLTALSKVKLRTELHEPPIEHLRRLSPPRIVSAEECDRRVRVEQI